MLQSFASNGRSDLVAIYLSLSFPLQECFTNHKLKQNLHMALSETYWVQLDVSLHRLGHDRDGITAARSLPHCIIVWQRLDLHRIVINL